MNNSGTLAPWEKTLYTVMCIPVHSHCTQCIHRLQLEMSNYHITGTVTHNNGTVIVQASTREFCIARHLYKTTDVSASHNIGRVLAQRCLETGVNRVMWEGDWTIKNNPKVREIDYLVSRNIEKF